MPTVHSVSDITSILSGVIQSESILQDVRVQGEVLVDGPPKVFWLRHGENKIRCFIPGGNTAQFGFLLRAGKTVVVNGKIALFSSFSQYQILVNTVVELGSISQQRTQPISVSKVTTNLKSIIDTADSLKNIHVQGKISDADIFLELRDAIDGIADSLPKIKCVSSGIGLPSVNLGDEVCLQGKISIYPQRSLYQVGIDSIELVPSGDGKARCQCNGCEQCLPLLGSALQCNRVSNPHLCAKCYAVNPNSENMVVRAVDSYFSQFQAFSTAAECEIQMGVDHRRADVVLIDREGIFAAIAECKRDRIVGYGPAQLKSYLCATDTRFGVFANSTNPDSWVFYENLRHNCFQQIDRSEFEEEVVEGIATRDRLSDEIKALELQLKQLEDKIDALKSKKAETTTEVRQESQKLDALKQVIEFDRVQNQKLKSSQKHLSEEISQLKTSKNELKTEIEKLERKERDLHTSRKQWEEKIQQFETFLANLKSCLLDSEPLPQSEDNVDPQRTRGQEKQSVMSKLKNLFSKENE